MRALIIEKSILIRRLLDRNLEGQTDPSVLHLPHLSRDEALVKEMEKERFPNVRRVWENRHSAGFRNVDESHDMLAAAKLEHGGARSRGMTQFEPLVDRTAGVSRDHSSIKGESRRH
jgi:hypothetical protein